VTEDDVLAAADALVAAFAATDTAAYFDCFTPDATFVFHPEPARLDNRAAYQALWADWLAAGWRVVSCTSTDRLVQLYGDVAVFSHAVRTTTSEGGVESTTDERETIVFTRVGERLLAVHEHLSPVPGD
jgi:ketosteroid isomerase-like protein